jgi:hypothetical protein
MGWVGPGRTPELSPKSDRAGRDEAYREEHEAWVRTHPGRNTAQAEQLAVLNWDRLE